MKPRTISILSMLLDLKAVAFDLLDSKHRNPALLNIYSFIDICASLSKDEQKGNREIFESFLENFATYSRWDRYSTFDLWASRSSILHSFSPLSHHTKKKKNPARPIFYYSWPEKKDEIETLLRNRGYTDFLLIDLGEIKAIAENVFNEMYRKIETEPDFEALFLDNAKNILPSVYHLKLEDELAIFNEYTRSLTKPGFIKN